jgi:hypothetical protein
MSPTFSSKLGCVLAYYGPTVSVTAGLMIVPDCAVMAVVPTATAVAVPPAIVATDGLLEPQLATLVMSVIPLQVVAFASKTWVLLAVETEMTGGLVGVTAIDRMHPTVTVTVCVPVIDGFLLDAAVTVACPVLTDVTKPEAEIVATEVGVMLQETEGLLVVLPSLFVANTVICTVLLVLPVSMLGDGGPTESEDMVGFWKNPVQLSPRAKTASAAKVPARRNFCLVDDI